MFHHHYHHSYLGGGYAHYGIGHMILSSLIHGMIYSMIFKMMRNLSIPEALVLVVAVLGVILLFSRHNRTRRPY